MTDPDDETAPPCPLDDELSSFSARYEHVRGRLDALAKPVGSLGTLEDWCARICALQRTPAPRIDDALCLVFAADHGAARDERDGGEGCSAYPPSVTRKVVEALDRGLAGACALARRGGARLRAVDVGVSPGPAACRWSGDVVRPAAFRLPEGTRNFCAGDAMTGGEVDSCLDVGRRETEKMVGESPSGGRLVVCFGEVGIGNTTSSSALIAALSGVPAEELCDGGASVNRAGSNEALVARKVSILERAMAFHGDKDFRADPKLALQAVGGAEIAALVGGMLECSERRIPVLVDGFIVTAAALVASLMDATATQVMLFATRSTERGQATALELIRRVARDSGYPEPCEPALNMGLRMGEGTGALAALPLVRSACSITEMATLREVLDLDMSKSADASADETPSSSKTEAFCSVFESSLSDIAAETGGPSDPAAVQERCIILSGGVDTCAIMAAARKLGIQFGGALTVVTSDESPDLGFSTACAAEHGLAHHVVRLTADELVDVYLPEVIELLEIYDGMVLRNSLVIAAVFKRAAELGFKHAVTGDGADELFGGYSFMWSQRDPEVWKEKRDSMCAKWTFSTSELAGKYGITAHSPYTARRTTDWAVANTVRSDCIGTRPIRLYHGGDLQDRETGKLILREAYDTVSSWRRKDPIEVGSGATVIGMDPFWSGRVSDEELEVEAESLAKRGYVVRTKEYLVNFRIWERTFGVDGARLTSGMKRLPLGEGCVDCCFDIGAEKMFCNLCGAYPAQRSAVAGGGNA